MAAVIAPNPNPRPLADPRRQARPPLHVIEGGRGSAQRRQAAVYRRRRSAAAVVVAALAALLWLAVVGAGSLASGADTRGDAVSGAAGTAPAPAAVAPLPDGPADSYVVQPGDTAWSIARSLHPEGDVRPLVDELVERAGGVGLQVGQRLSLDGLGD